MLTNGETEFGGVTRALHWAVAALVLSALPLGAYLSRAEITLSNLWLFGLHKSIGVTVLGLMVARVLWHRISPVPPPLPAPHPWQDRLARGVHLALYPLLLAVPLSGWAASSATGIDTVIWGTWTLPGIAPVSERVEEVGFAVHGVLTKLLFMAIALHLAGVAHRIARRDGTLSRMVRGRRGAGRSRDKQR